MLCTVLTQHLSSRQSEVCSETLCWIMLPVLFTVARRWDISTISTATLSSDPGSHAASSTSLWIVAAGIATACCYKAEMGMIGFLVGSSSWLKKGGTLTKDLAASVDSASSDS